MAKNIQRPQLKFKDSIDNSNTPFIPIIKSKPNALKPLQTSKFICLVYFLVVTQQLFFSCVTISNGNRTEWSTIQGAIGQVISNQMSM